MKYTVLYITSILCLATITSCNRQKPLDIQGHRGWRGRFPENSMEGFIQAIQLGVTTLEMDVVMTKDSVLVLQHEPILPAERCEFAGTDTIFLKTKKELEQCYCGNKSLSRFPLQTPSIQPIYSLKEVLEKTTEYCVSHQLPLVNYNIEMKSEKEHYHTLYPSPAAFSTIMLHTIQPYKERVVVQSFDANCLNEIHQLDKNLSTAFLIEKGDVVEEIHQLHYKPKICSPDFHLLEKEAISLLQKNEIQVIPWTVNTTAEMRLLMDWGVDGIITDYPDSLIALLKH